MRWKGSTSWSCQRLRRSWTSSAPIRRPADSPPRVDKPHVGLLSLVEQHAVLYPVAGAQAGAPTTPATRPTRSTRRSDASAWVLCAPYKAGSDVRSQDGLTPGERRYSCNPGGAITYCPTSECNNRLCVHCWMRQAGAEWRRLDAALFPRDAPGRRPKHVEYDLVIATRIVRGRALDVYRTENGLDLAQALADRCSRTRNPDAGRIQGRGYEARMIPAFGRLEVATPNVRWVDRGGGHGYEWQIEVRQLLVVKRGQRVEIPGAKIRRIRRPTRRNLAVAVGRTRRFPAALLPAEDTLSDGNGPHEEIAATYCAATAGRKLTAATGICGVTVPVGRPAVAARKCAAKTAIVQPEVVAPERQVAAKNASANTGASQTESSRTTSSKMAFSPAPTEPMSSLCSDIGSSVAGEKARAAIRPKTADAPCLFSPGEADSSSTTPQTPPVGGPITAPPRLAAPQTRRPGSASINRNTTRRTTASGDRGGRRYLSSPWGRPRRPLGAAAAVVLTHPAAAPAICQALYALSCARRHRSRSLGRPAAGARWCGFQGASRRLGPWWDRRHGSKTSGWGRRRRATAPGCGSAGRSVGAFVCSANRRSAAHVRARRARCDSIAGGGR